MKKIRVNNQDWIDTSETNPARLRDGLKKFREALEQDAKEAEERGSGLPKDWRNRTFRIG